MNLLLFLSFALACSPSLSSTSQFCFVKSEVVPNGSAYFVCSTWNQHGAVSFRYCAYGMWQKQNQKHHHYIEITRQPHIHSSWISYAIHTDNKRVWSLYKNTQTQAWIYTLTLCTVHNKHSWLIDSHSIDLANARTQHLNLSTLVRNNKLFSYGPIFKQ